MAGILYLLPVPIAAVDPADVLPPPVLATARRLGYFLAEDARSARAFLKAAGHPRPIASLQVVEIGHAPDPDLIDGWLAPLRADPALDAAVVSEAGCPGIADPGAELVARAHDLGIPVRPLVGPSSILLALMAAGLNGQRFRFLGYLPQAGEELVARLRGVERDARLGETQVFIETGYRNQRLFETLLRQCDPDTRLAVAVDLTGAAEFARQWRIADWRQLPVSLRPDLSRRPAVFLLGTAPPARQRAPRDTATGGRRARH